MPKSQDGMPNGSPPYHQRFFCGLNDVCVGEIPPFSKMELHLGERELLKEGYGR